MKYAPYLLLTVFSALLFSCGREATETENEEFAPYSEVFKTYAKKRGHSTESETEVSIIFGDVSGREEGACEQGLLKSPQIIIGKERWESMGETDRETLILHELGHCILNRDHDNSVLRGSRSSRPKSLMHSSGVLPRLYLEFKEEYLAELFGATSGS